MADMRVFSNGGWVEVAGTTAGYPIITSPVFTTGLIRIPGIGPAAAYAAADAFGIGFSFAVPTFGTISNITFLDHDDEGLRKDLVIFSDPFTATADNSAFNVSDDNLRLCLGVISVDVFYNFGANQVGIATPLFSYVAPTGRLYCQWVTQGADNIAATAIPEFHMEIV